MLAFVIQHLYFIREAELKGVTHAIFFCPFNVFSVYFYRLKLHLSFLTTFHSVVFNRGDKSFGESAFFVLKWSRSTVNRYTECEKTAEFILRDDPYVWRISSGECWRLLVRWLTRPVAPNGESRNYVSGVCTFVVRRPCIGTLWGEYWSLSYERDLSIDLWALQAR
jgi:hypothetical protein